MINHLCLLFLLLSQLVTGEKKHQPVEIMDATVQQWISGAPGGRTGTTWHIKVLVNTNKQVEFKNLWIGKENVPFETQFYSNKFKQSILPGDSVLLVHMHVNDQKSGNENAKSVPVEYKGAALIECIVGKQAWYFTVDNFRELPVHKGE